MLRSWTRDRGPRGLQRRHRPWPLIGAAIIAGLVGAGRPATAAATAEATATAATVAEAVSPPSRTGPGGEDIPAETGAGEPRWRGAALASASVPASVPALVQGLVLDLQRRFPQRADAPIILIDALRQELLLVERLEVVDRWPVSTAEAGLGSRLDSRRTPTGAHRLAHKIGHGARPGTIFDARRPTGRQARILTAPGARSGQDLVTSRVMWLDGLEPGRNRGGTVDSRQRLIYIHGTDEEGRIGTPASLGCIRMRNQDVIELFERVREDTLVFIAEHLG